METFTNSVIIPKNLPEIEKEQFNPLDKKYLKILFIRISLFFLFLTGGLTTLLIVSDEDPPTFVLLIIIGIIVLAISYSVIITILGFLKKGYLVREKDISFQKGIIIFKSTSVPFNRIQHVEVNQGILAKMFKLSSVKIYTAGGTASDLSIPGLPTEVAHNMKTFLSEKISEHE